MFDNPLLISMMVQCLVDWKEEFKFEEFGGIFKSSLDEYPLPSSQHLHACSKALFVENC